MTFLMNNSVEKPLKKKLVKVGKSDGTTEKDVISAIDGLLGIYPEIFWYTRLNSGKVETKWGSWVKLCDKGTPDFVAAIYFNGIISLLFIEAKKPGGTQQVEQLEFENSVRGIKNVFYILTETAEKVNQVIHTIIYKE